MAGKKSIREQFGLDYLGGGDKAQDARQANVAAGKDIPTPKQLRQMQRVLEQLRDAPEHMARVHSLIDPTGLSIQELLQLTESLEKHALIRVIELDKLGNHLIRITQPGLEFLES